MLKNQIPLTDLRLLHPNFILSISEFVTLEEISLLKFEWFRRESLSQFGHPAISSVIGNMEITPTLPWAVLWTSEHSN